MGLSNRIGSILLGNGEKVRFNSGSVIGLAISKEKGTQKKQVEVIKLLEGVGIKGDAHSGSYRQVSLLAREERDRIALKSLKPGESAENILIDGIDNFSQITPGCKIKIGKETLLEVLQVGKEFHDSPIHKFTGKPILPVVGVFCRVLKGGIIRMGDTVRVIE